MDVKKVNRKFYIIFSSTQFVVKRLNFFIVFILETENVNGLSEEIIPVTKTVLNTSDETDCAVNTNNSNKSSTPKLLKKSQSEHLDLLNKNVRSVNGSSAQDSDSSTGDEI